VYHIGGLTQLFKYSLRSSKKDQLFNFGIPDEDFKRIMVRGITMDRNTGWGIS
jgi:hypothetical protein